MGSQGPVIRLSWLAVGLIGQVGVGGGCERLLFGSVHYVYMSRNIKTRGVPQQGGRQSGSVVCLDTIYLYISEKNLLS